MTALEIVLISVLGLIVVISVFYLLVFHTNKVNRMQIFTEVNQHAKKGAIVFFGDSLTDFYPIQDFFPTYPIYNRGVAGDKTSDLIKRIDDIIHIQPRKVFIQIGTNDLGHAVKPAKIVANIRFIYQKLQENIPGVEIIAISLYPISHHKMWLSPIIAGIRSNKNIILTNHLLKELTTEMKISYIDLHSQLVDNKGRLHADYTLEGLHLSGRGYGQVSSQIFPYL